MKLLFLIADGMADWPLDELHGATPLEAARTPHMDALARRALIGRVRTVPAGMPPGSDVANMALLGFEPARYHTGRGPIEAAAQGIATGPDDLVWRLNLVRVDNWGPEGVMRDYAGGHPDPATVTDLVSRLQSLAKEPFAIHKGVQYRHLLVEHDGAKGPGAGLDIRPPHDILDQPIAQDLAAYAGHPALAALLEAAQQELSSTNTTANACWPWGQGRTFSLPPFAEAYGLRGAVVTAVDLVRGLGRAAGMEVLEVEGATGLLDTNYEGKVAATLEFLERGGEFVYLHVEAPDECGHGGCVADKVEAIERFDARIVGPLVDALGGEAAYFVGCDHLTPVSIRTHHSDPVPYLLAWKDAPEGPGVFSEAAALTSQVVEPGHTLMGLVLEALKAGQV